VYEGDMMLKYVKSTVLLGTLFAIVSMNGAESKPLSFSDYSKSIKEMWFRGLKLQFLNCLPADDIVVIKQDGTHNVMYLGHGEEKQFGKIRRQLKAKAGSTTDEIAQVLYSSIHSGDTTGPTLLIDPSMDCRVKQQKILRDRYGTQIAEAGPMLMKCVKRSLIKQGATTENPDENPEYYFQIDRVNRKGHPLRAEVTYDDGSRENLYASKGLLQTQEK
jgi:hypothetical protein